ncbi:endonuclease/exonuclease/phosphatase family protein [uncultured Pseudokineococcus sp.]|uniref:endonuclease/exonuclease/phosphatase family protein n=1 Tax=uncultured Pseudokineococcus sp. TaxID=1642928 RepID=UPI0026060402|nr:endonuclease/exonuclease/phosphatase family protein [uncultured Pseudokineococcus sp.]
MLVGLLVVVLGAAATTTRWWDVDPARRAAPLVVRVQALVPLVGPAALVVLAQALVAGAGWTAAAAGALVAVHAGLALPGWWVAGAQPAGAAPGPAGPRVRVLALNTWYGRADAAAAAALVRRLRPDVLALVEVSPAALERLERAGATDELPHRAGRAADDGVGTLVLSRWPVAARDDDRLGSLPARGTADPAGGADRTSDNPLVEVAPPGGPPLLVRAVHPYYPALDDVAPWRRQLRSLDRWAREQAAARPDVPLVVLGDLNATADHPALRRLLAPQGPLALTSRSSGRGRPRTWPDVGPMSAVLALDHVLVRGVVVRASGTASLPGTDHAAAWADLELPPAAP